jgi:hypothetical protein
MASYLTIPDMVESEPLLSVSPSPDGVTFGIVIDAGNTAVQLMRANSDGQRIPLVVLTTDASILALDDVFVTEVSTSSGHPAATYITFLAQAVRFV